MAALAMVLVVVTAVTLAVGLLGFVRIRKDRPSPKSYELEVPSPGESMGCDGARTPASKTDEPETASMDTDESHMRARAGEARRQDGDDASLLRCLGTMLWQFTGIPLLAGLAAPPDARPTATPIDTAAMGNTAAPTRTLLSGTTSLHSPTATSNKNLSAEVDALRDSKVATSVAGPSEAASADRPWSDADESNASAYASSEEEDDDTTTESQQTDDEKFEELRAHIMMDGLQFYTAVASASVATVSHAVDIALFRATTIVLRERRKAHEEASIHAIEKLYPDIMCLPPNANVRYAAGPLKPAESSLAAHATVAATMSPRTTARQLETGFLKAA